MNPEFIRESTAVRDFLHPDKIVLGADGTRALGDMHTVFDPLIKRTEAPVVETNTRTAEMIKYANNSFLAAKVSLINDIGNICKEFGVDAYEVAVGSAPTIGSVSSSSEVASVGEGAASLRTRTHLSLLQMTLGTRRTCSTLLSRPMIANRNAFSGYLMTT